MRYGMAGRNIAAISSVLMKCPSDVKRKKNESPTLARVLEAIRKRVDRFTKVSTGNGTTSNAEEIAVAFMVGLDACVPGLLRRRD